MIRLIIFLTLLSGCGQITVEPKEVKVKVYGNVYHNIRLDPTFEAYFRRICINKLDPNATEEQIQGCIAEEVERALRL
jgi:uncharacterized protein YceK